MRFSSLVLAAASATLALAAPGYKRATGNKLEFWGVNESGAEFGNTDLPGVYGKDYTWYDLSTYDTLIARGMNIFRLNFQVERLAQGTLDAPLDAAYLGNLTQQVNYITSRGAYALITPHNYGRYNGAIVTDTVAFGKFHQNIAAVFKNNSKVMFDTDNEFHDMPQTLVVQLNQAAINGIRAAGAVTQYITVEGNSYTGAWTWTNATDSAGLTNGATMGALTDPSNLIIYQMHQYLDSDSSGTSATCVSSTIFQERLVAATNWLRTNKKIGLIGEFAGGDNPTCITALTGGLTYMTQNTDVWKGAVWWAAGPWWGTYIYNIEPTAATGIYTDVLPALEAVIKN